MASKSYEVDVPTSTLSSTYDANGNLIAQGTKTYEWDAADRLTRVLDDGIEIARFAYDGTGRRVQKVSSGTARNYVYDGMDILEERSSSGTIRTVHGPGIDRPLASVDGGGAVTYYLADHLGSIVQQTNASAAVTLVRQYDPYGVPLQGAATSGYAFTGREWEGEIALYYYRARYYDPQRGSFLSRDPSGFGGSTTYGYVDNRPVSAVDPLGLFGVQFGSLTIGWGDPWLLFDRDAVVASSKGAQGALDAMAFGYLRDGFDQSWMNSGYSGVKCDEDFAIGHRTGTVSREALIAAIWPAGLNGGSNSVFWSGFEYGAKTIAETLGKTLTKTPIGAALEYLQYGRGIPIPDFVWKLASATFAANAKGSAIAVIRYERDAWRIESQILEFRNIPIIYR
jgi:RHS repeat-associated protein